MRVLGGIGIAAAIAIATMPTEAAARDYRPGQVRPWGRGTVLPSFGFGVGIGRDFTSLGFGLGASYFVANGFAVGLSLSDSVLILKDSLKSEFPGVGKQIPTNVFSLTPTLQYVFFRSRWFSPYVHAGVGPAFFNNQRGTVGAWLAGPGAFIGIGGPVFLDIGVDFFGKFPTGKCNRAYTYESEGSAVQFQGFCSFGWSPNIGIVVAFGGGGGKSRRARPSSPPPDNPLPEDELVEPPPQPVETIEPPPPSDAPVDAPVEDPDVPPPTEMPAEPPSEPVGPPPPEGTPTPPVAVPP